MTILISSASFARFRGTLILVASLSSFEVYNVANAMDTKKAWLEVALEEELTIYEPDSIEDYSGQFKLRIPKSLYCLLAEHSQKEGISLNQYCLYLLSRNGCGIYEVRSVTEKPGMCIRV